MQKARRAAIELALNIIYQVDVAGIPLKEAIETAREHVEAEAEVFDHAELLAKGTLKHIREIDQNIRRLSVDWPPDRQPAVDRNIIRMAMFEMTHVETTPPVVVVNEAIELAKKFSTEDSGKFINGVLAAYLREQESKK
ncbi:MAG TPA: transcription antitermination factor NusB [Armatimonadota bacterium]|nr:transcription antitermination factor NusB [Armatimonadota bacterium]